MRKLISFWYGLSDKIRFAVVGCFNAGIMYLIYVSFIFILGEKQYQIALALAWFFSSITSFLTHKYFVFNSKGNIIKQYIKCCSIWVISYFINAVLLEIFVKYIHMNVFISQILAPTIAGIFTYFMFKKVAFKVKKERKINVR